MIAFNVLLKIGGSIFDNSRLLVDFFQSFSDNLNPELRYIIIFGGGKSCNLLREEYSKSTPSMKLESEFHRKCIKSMEKNAEVIFPQIIEFFDSTPVCLIKPKTLENVKNPGIYILQTYEDLFETNSLEHTWRVSSDSIAVYYANKLKCPICVLVKDKPFLFDKNIFLYRITSTKLISLQKKKILTDQLGKGLVDTLCPHLSRKFNIPILILDGSDRKITSKFFASFSKKYKEEEIFDFGIVINPK